ncbi:MAG: hypothetical protein EPN30_03010 [Actinomycetota bacterium]|nr:MAG: hypothetical protein EPN30_03010 [Actinomycetota bacterium]
MTKKHVWILRATSVWTFYVWAVLIRNMIIDKTNTLGFRGVHIGLAIISIALAAIAWRISNFMAKEIKLRKKSKDAAGRPTLSNPAK